MTPDTVHALGAIWKLFTALTLILVILTPGVTWQMGGIFLLVACCSSYVLFITYAYFIAALDKKKQEGLGKPALIDEDEEPAKEV